MKIHPIKVPQPEPIAEILDKLQAVLQQVRQRALDADGQTRRRLETARSGADEIHRLIGRLLASRLAPAQVELLTALAHQCDELVARLAPASDQPA